jgi:hypothetical protein
VSRVVESENKKSLVVDDMNSDIDELACESNTWDGTTDAPTY